MMLSDKMFRRSDGRYLRKYLMLYTDPNSGQVKTVESIGEFLNGHHYFSLLFTWTGVSYRYLPSNDPVTDQDVATGNITVHTTTNAIY